MIAPREPPAAINVNLHTTDVLTPSTLPPGYRVRFSIHEELDFNGDFLIERNRTRSLILSLARSLARLRPGEWIPALRFYLFAPPKNTDARSSDST